MYGERRGEEDRDEGICMSTKRIQEDKKNKKRCAIARAGEKR